MPSRVSGQRGEPRICVIIPCYRDHELLPHAVASVEEEEPVELVVVDDGSDDPQTHAVLERLEADGVRVVRQSRNRGAASARNVGLRETSAPFIFPLDSDDLAVRGALGQMADKLEERLDAVACFGDYMEFGDSTILRAVPEELDPYRVAYTNEYPVSALFRRAALQTAGGWSEGVGYEDWHLWMTLAEAGGCAVHLGRGIPTYRRRLHGERMLTRAKRSHPVTYARLRQDHPRLFKELRAHRRRSRLSPIRKALYPLLYGGRRRLPWEPRVKAMLDRCRIWTLRR